MTFGEDWGWGSSPAGSVAIPARFLERGGNFIDTANIYNDVKIELPGGAGGLAYDFLRLVW
jgi:aryl-alcohol dehydrogenase-like predicted oxidoreductase